MADVTRRLFLRHLRGTPTTWVRHHVDGQIRHEGIGQSFWYRPLTAVLSEVPVDDRELPLLFHARTSDFADVTVQATVTYRVTEPALAATRLDFSIDPQRGTWRAQPLDQVATLLAELAQQPALDLLARLPLTEALDPGIAPVREAVARPLAARPAAHRDRGERGQRPGRRDPARAGAGAGPADPDPGGGAAGGGPGHLRPPGPRGRAGTGHRRERAAEQDRAGPARAAAGRAAAAPTTGARPNSTRRPVWSRRRRRPSGSRSRQPAPPTGPGCSRPPKLTRSGPGPRPGPPGSAPSAGRGRGGGRETGGVPRPAAGGTARAGAAGTRRQPARDRPAHRHPGCGHRPAHPARSVSGPWPPSHPGWWWCRRRNELTNCWPGTAPGPRPGTSCGSEAGSRRGRGPAPTPPGGAGRGRRGDPGRLAPRPPRPGRPAPVPVRAGGRRRRGRAGRAGRQRREVPGRPAGNRGQTRTLAATPGCWPATGPRTWPGCWRPRPPALPDRGAHHGRRRPSTTGRRLVGLNEVYFGHASHQSARYLITTADGGPTSGSRPPGWWSAPAPGRPAGAPRSPGNALSLRTCPHRRSRPCAGSSGRPGRPRRPGSR